MILIPSVLISSLSGKAGNVVAASWKGIQYARALVIPANPKSVDQTTQRDFLTKIVAWWHDIEEQLQDYCKILAAGQPMSGFNCWTKRNLQDLADEVMPRIMPLNATVNPISGFSAATGAGATKEIDLTWSQGEAVAADKVYIIAVTYMATTFGSNVMLIEKETTQADAESLTITMAEAAMMYWVWALVEHEADSTFSVAVGDNAESKT